MGKNLILRFLFIEFNEDTENLLNYMNKSISVPIPNENFSDEEKTEENKRMIEILEFIEKGGF